MGKGAGLCLLWGGEGEPGGVSAPQFLLTHCYLMFYKQQTFRIEKFVVCIWLEVKWLTEIVAERFPAPT